ncbi:MAG TPA: aminotransferase class IV [Myxococcota bacterium]|nr:aminotransferase class IV [Myxococcota bacterium]
MADFALYEALLHEPGVGWFLLERHVARLAGSAAHFGFRFDEAALRARLASLARELPPEPRKVRLELSSDGALFAESAALGASSAVRAALAAEPVDSRDPFLRHKTSRRGVYERALAALPAGAGEVLLWNERGELTETSSANLVIELGARRVTPPLASGLLPGTFREELLSRGELEEGVVLRTDLARAGRVWAINSVRRWREVEVEGRA